MHNISLNKILLVAVILLAIGEGFLFFRGSPQGRAALVDRPGASMPAPSDSTVTSMPAPTTILVPIGGTVAKVSGNVLTLSAGAESSIGIVVGSDTVIVKEGTLKDAATYARDLEQFHAYSNQLMQDPQKNQLALQTLVAPSRNVETTLTLSQISPGMTVAGFADGQNADGTYRALRITVLAASAPR